MNKESILQLFPFAPKLGKANRSEMLRQATSGRLEAGTFFFREGERCPNVAFVGEGLVRVFKSEPNGREITMYHVRPGEVCLVNMLSALRGIAAPANAIAEEDTHALLLPKAALRKWVVASARFRDFAFDSMVGRLVHVMTLVEEVTFHRMDLRLAQLLVQRTGQAARLVAVTHEQLAADLGTVREVVSRLLKDFERAGAVELSRGRVLVRDLSLLRALAVRGLPVSALAGS